MKKTKKVTLLFFSVFIVMFGFMGVVKADEYNSSDEGKIIFKTEIRKWTPVNDLVWHGEDKCDGKDCTYSAYLVGRGYNGTTVVDDLRVDLPIDEDVALGVNLSGDSYQTNWQNYLYKFYAGTTVTLYEVFDYESGSCGDYLYCVNQSLDTIEYNLSDNLYFTFDDDDLADQSLSNCNNYNGNSYYVYYDKVNTGSEYTYVSNGEKFNNIDNGYIELPVYYVDLNFHYYGNLMGSAGYNVGDLNVPVSEIGFSSYYRQCALENSSCRDNVLRNSSIGGGNYAMMTYEQFIGIKNELSSPSQYSFLAYNPNYESSSISTTYSYNEEDGCYIEEDYDGNPAAIAVYCDITKDASVPNGLFYNILPFIIILGIAGVGVVVLKKTKLKA